MRKRKDWQRKGLIIASSTVGMESARSYRKASASVRRFVITEYQGGPNQGEAALNAAVGDNTQSALTAGKEGDGSGVKNGEGQAAGTVQNWQDRFQMSSARLNIRNSPAQMFEDIRQTTIRYIFDLLFSSRRNRLTQWRDNGMQAYDSGSGAAVQGSTQINYGQGTFRVEPTPVAIGNKVLSYSQETIQMEAEDTAFSTAGTVRTADGREIDFNVNVGMSRRFQETFRDELELASFTMCDPLVINLDTDVASLSDQTFYFDIDADGEEDEVAGLGAGSGYLALDKNGDGVVNDGSELFGTSSGNGFADLAEYDEDGNGWIDEADAVWDKLKIWVKDENGNDVLYRLADRGVGAICLQNAATDFTLTGQNGQTNGAIRNTGVFLYENGNMGTVQHVDVAKYDKGA